MTSLNISIVTWVVDTITKMKNNKTEDTLLWPSSLSDANGVYNNFAQLFKAELENRGGCVICSNNKKHLVSFNDAFFTIILELTEQSISFKIVQFYDEE